MSSITVVCIEGDGIGPEITAAMKQVVEVATRGTDLLIEWDDVNIGVRALESVGELLPEEVLEKIRSCGLAIKGPTVTPVGEGYRSANVLLRQKLSLYANIRPIVWFEGIDTPIKRPENVNLIIFRENTEDVYAGIEYAAGSSEAYALHEFLHLPEEIPYDSAIGLKPVSEVASRRIARKAVQHAIEKNRKRITIVHKGNIMKFTEGAFCAWGYDEAKKILGDRFLSSEEHLGTYGGEVPEGRILVQDRIADAMFQDLLLHPERHEVLVTLNLNGDYLSDAGAALVGGLGLASGMNVGDDAVLFEAVHGTAPDIAGKNMANPSALILSAALMFEHLGYKVLAQQVVAAIQEAIKKNMVTGDLYSPKRDGELLSCSAFGEHLSSLL